MYNNLGVLCRDEGEIARSIEYYERCVPHASRERQSPQYPRQIDRARVPR